MSQVRRTPALAAAALALAVVVAPAPSPAACPTALGDVAPGVLDPSTSPPTYWIEGDGEVNTGDVVVLLRHVAVLHDVRWSEAASGCPRALPGDVAPGRIDEGTQPATWVQHPDDAVDLGDVIVLLRLAVGLEVSGDDVLTYYRDAKPIFDERCGSCHATGGIGPFPLTSYDEITPLGQLVHEALEVGEMPPWPPGGECASYEHDRSLTDRELDVLLSWIEQGMAAGDPRDEPPPPEPPEPVAFDTVLSIPEPYQPQDGLDDDYRCFIVDWPHDVTKYVTALQVVPDRADMVHHVIVFSIGASGVAEVEARDAAEPGVGYTCFGGPGTNDAKWIGAWVPGASGGEFADGTGIRMDPGGTTVIQMHYNMDYTEPLPDQSTVEFRTADVVDRPAEIVILVDAGFFIPAGHPMLETERTFSTQLAPGVLAELGIASDEPYRIHDVGLHMHQLGTTTSLGMSAPDGSERCLLDIGEWDFHWQGAYRLAEPALVRQGYDRVTLRCAWDNTPENQPYVDGVQQDPVNVTWGDGSRDEMCLAFVYVAAP